MKKNVAGINVMNNYDLRNIIFSFFRSKFCEDCKKYKKNCVKTEKYCICYECFFENWKTLWHL